MLKIKLMGIMRQGGCLWVQWVSGVGIGKWSRYQGLGGLGDVMRVVKGGKSNILHTSFEIIRNTP